MHEYPRRLHHRTLGWVKESALFHVRVRTLPEQRMVLTDPRIGPELLAAAKRYHDLGRWWCELFLLMPIEPRAIG